ncbi:MAG: AAA family ATPase [Actinomycetota bacterium]|nr:AAA family ATPase [Actinomycetota bacterium]
MGNDWGPLIAEDSPPLLQRDWELNSLNGALEAARGGDGSLVVIAGAPGTGKTALLSAALKRARGRGFMIRQGRGSELEQELSFGGIRQLFEPLLRSVPLGERRRLLSGAAAPAARLFTDTPLDHGARGDGGFATLHGLYWLAAGLSAGGPLMLAVDDVHWLDAPSLRALNYLAGRLADVPIALFVAMRPHAPNSVASLVHGLESQPAALRLELAALQPFAVGEIVRAAIPEASEDLCAAFYESSAGNPFYLRELLRSLASETGAVPLADAVRRATVASVGDRVMRRVARLGSRAPRLAAAMAVLGSGGRLRDAAAVCGQDEPDAATAARGMRRVEILAAEDPFEWIHPLVRRSIYDSLTVAERDALHERAADVLATAGASPSAVAVHLSALRPAGSASVVAGLLAAADEALALDAPEVAVAALRRALAEEAQEPSRAALLLRLGQVEVTRRDPGAADVLGEVLHLSEDPRERALASMALGESQIHSGQWDAAAATIAAAIEEDDGSDPALTLELEMVHAVDCALEPALVDDFWGKRERLLILSQDDSWAGRALSALFALVYGFRGEPLEQVLPLCDRALAGGVLIAERGAGAWVPSHILGGLVVVEAYERASGFADELESAARAQGSVANAIVAKGYRGWAAARQGDLAGAEEILRPIADAAVTNGMLLALVTVLWYMADVMLERPSQEEMLGLSESLELPEAFMETAGGAWVMLVRGRVRAFRGAREQAERDLRAAGGILDRLRFGPSHDAWRSALALILLPEQLDEARTLVEEELALAQETGLDRPRGIVLRAAGLLAGGDEGVEILRESVAVLAESPARYEHARSLVELGAALRRSGRRGDAREPLEAGMELGQSCGAERLVVRAYEELLAAGLRPRRIVRSGFGALTASERRIVRLAAAGHSNPEIAQALYVSLKTVETHLSHAYRKLDLSGPRARRRLPDLVAQAS